MRGIFHGIGASLPSLLQCPANHCRRTAVTSLDQYHHCQASVQQVEPRTERKRSLHQLHQGLRMCFQKHLLPHLIIHPGPHLHVLAQWVSSIVMWQNNLCIYLPTYLSFYCLLEFGHSSNCSGPSYLVKWPLLCHQTLLCMLHIREMSALRLPSWKYSSLG
jgi:hypothetical protein